MSSLSLSPPPPDPAVTLFDYPTKDWLPSFRLFRVGRRNKGTWWFSGDGSGRFDLDFASTGRGTCYFGTDNIAAISEVFRAQPVLEDDISSRTIRTIGSVPKRPLADTTVVACRPYGLTREIADVTPYDLPQAWAAAWHEANFDGIFHYLRHDVRPRVTGVSFFGDHVEGPLTKVAPFPCSHEERDMTSVEVASAGVQVLPRPPMAGLVVT